MKKTILSKIFCLAGALTAPVAALSALDVVVSEFIDGEPTPPGYVNVTGGVPTGSALRVSHAPFVDYIIPANSGGTAAIIAVKEGGVYLSNPSDPNVFSDIGSGGGANNLITPDAWQIVFEWEDGEPVPFGEDFYGVSWANWSNTQFATMTTRVDLPDDNPVKVWHFFNDGWNYGTDGSGHTVLNGHVLSVTHYNAANTMIAEEEFVLVGGKAAGFFGDHRAFYTAEITVQRQAEGDYVIIDNIGANIGYKGTVVELLEATEPTEWAGFPIINGAYVDTGDFLGMLFLAGDFIYVFDLGGWAYLPESLVESSGTWLFIFR